MTEAFRKALQDMAPFFARVVYEQAAACSYKWENSRLNIGSPTPKPNTSEQTNEGDVT